MMRNPQETIGNLIDKQGVSFIGSVGEDGWPAAKAMLPPVRREGIKTLYWHTNTSSLRVRQYAANPKACVYFYDKRFFRGVMLQGTMDVLGDKKTLKAFWKDEYTMYYRDGIAGGDFTVLRFTARSGRYYSNFHSEDFQTD